MKAKSADWYKQNWSLDIKNQSWVENTGSEVDFLIRTMQLTGEERVLDLACGFGRHSLELARRGFSVVGIDLTPAYIEDAKNTARQQGLKNADFFCEDIREVGAADEFDVVLNLADGAIGYLENDEENLKIFDVIARALKKGGKHFMDVCNADHAERYFPKLGWEAGEKAISLSQFEWNPQTRRMLFGGCEIPYGVAAKRPEIAAGDPTRLYSVGELTGIFGSRGMKIVQTFSDYSGTPSGDRFLQLMVYSQKW